MLFKILILFFLIQTLNSFTLKAQTNSELDKNLIATTLDEYNYTVKGYPYQIKMGLTISKEGYEIKRIHTYYAPEAIAQGKRLTVDYVGVYRKDAKIPCSIIAIANQSSPNPQYICIPHPNTSGQVASLCRQTILSLPESRLRLYYFGLQDLYTKGNIKSFFNSKRKEVLNKVGWAQEIKDEFIKYCKKDIVPSLKTSKDTNIICYCVLDKVIKQYPSPADTKDIKDEVISMAQECLQ